MALTPLEIKHCELRLAAFLKRRRPPPAIRDEIDLGYELVNQSVELFEIRPDWRDHTKTTRSPVAKATYVRSQDLWRLYWIRRELKWHSYTPRPVVEDIDEFLNVVDADEHS